ncbi:MAG: N-6 DNA methylase, partial [Oscillospiraceae bacterium]|nr:N-6 DNA methylase [Oscillospiraceae bacterium]
MFRDGEYTLFPGIENIPEPGAVLPLPRVDTAQTGNAPRSNEIFDLTDDNDRVRGWADTPESGEQLTLFSIVAQEPNLPSVDEQRTAIDQSLKQEAAEVEAAFLVEENSVDESLLNISDSDKERLTAQIAENPRSRETVKLVKEIYGDGLTIPVPQAVKRLTELVSEGKFDVPAQKSELHLQAVGDFYELTGSEAQIAAEVLGFTVALRDGDALVGFPNSVLEDYVGRLAEAGYAVIVPETLEAKEQSAPEYKVGDRLMYGGKLHEITKIDDYVQVENRELDNPARYPIFDRVAIPRERFERELASGELKIEPPQEVQPEAATPPQAGEPYSVGDTVWIDNREFRISEIGDSYKEADDLDRQFGTFGRSIELWDVALSNVYPITRSMYQGEFEFKLSLDDRNERFLPLAEAAEQPNLSAENDESDELDEMEMQFVFDEPETPIELDFDTVAQTVLERVMSGESYKAALADATSRASLRNPCTMAVEETIRDHFDDEPEVFRQYFSNDDFNDKLFDYVLRQSWENRPQQQQAQLEAEQKSITDEPQFTEITDPAELAEIEAIFGGTKETEQPVTPPKSYVEGSRIVLDLRAKHTGLVGEFHIDAVDDGTITVSKNSFTETITRAEAEQYEIKPIAERVLREPDTTYYLMRYQEGVDAGATVSHDELSLITEFAKRYVICAEACYLSESDMERYNITFRKMPRDWNLLPSDAQSEIRKLKPEYETQWQEMYGEVPPPRYDIRPLAHVQQISSNPRIVDIEERPQQYGIWDSEKKVTYGVGGYLKYDDGRYLTFDSEADAAHFIAELENGTVVFPPRQIPAVNFRINDDHLGEGGAKTKFRGNIEAIRTLHTIETEQRNATPDEQEILSRYVGWGGLPQAFDERNNDWAKEYGELKGLLTSNEYDSARGSTLNAHYTSPTVIKAMWETAERLGFKSGNVLEPAMGVGNFYGLIPDSMRQAKLYGVELDTVTAKIAHLLYPNANIQQTGYERTEFSDAFFDLAVGNVPFGGYSVVDKHYKQNFQIHDYFFQKTLDKVRPGGVIAFITSKGTLDKKNPEVRKYIAQRAELLGAVRLPNTAF